jgi:hypothetical protein
MSLQQNNPFLLAVLILKEWQPLFWIASEMLLLLGNSKLVNQEAL